MDGQSPAQTDSQTDPAFESGGRIPGSPGWPGFQITRAEEAGIPVVIAAPHAGRAYPPSLVSNMRHADDAAMKLEDRFVDRLAMAVARQTGAAMLIAHAPRAMIDLNRAPDEMDWTMLRDGPPPGRDTKAMARRARGGLGLVPRRLQGIGEIWRQQIGRAELDARVDRVHRPYHTALSAALDALCDRWGAALLIDLHSMPPLKDGVQGGRSIEFVIGDRFGATCDQSLVSAAIERLETKGRPVAHNRPYAGGYVLDRHGAPRREIHAMQLEVCRTSYLNAALRDPGERFEATADVITSTVKRLAELVIRRGETRSFLQAAE